MPTIIAVALTAALTPRFSTTFNYQGASDRTVEVDIICPTWDLEDPSINVTVEVQQSFDNGDTWEAFATLATNPGRHTRSGGMPTITCQVVDNLGARLARAQLMIDSGSIVLGVGAVVV